MRIKKKISKVFFYLIPVIIIFGIGVIIATTMSILPRIGVNTKSYKQVLGEKTYNKLTGVR